MASSSATFEPTTQYDKRAEGLVHGVAQGLLSDADDMPRGQPTVEFLQYALGHPALLDNLFVQQGRDGNPNDNLYPVTITLDGKTYNLELHQNDLQQLAQAGVKLDVPEMRDEPARPVQPAAPAPAAVPTNAPAASAPDSGAQYPVLTEQAAQGLMNNPALRGMVLMTPKDNDMLYELTINGKTQTFQLENGAYAELTSSPRVLWNGRPDYAADAGMTPKEYVNNILDNNQYEAIGRYGQDLFDLAVRNPGLISVTPAPESMAPALDARGRPMLVTTAEGRTGLVYMPDSDAQAFIMAGDNINQTPPLVAGAGPIIPAAAPAPASPADLDAAARARADAERDAAGPPAPAAAPAPAAPAATPEPLNTGQMVDDGRTSPREIRIMQSAMQKLGLYEGQPNGQMDEATRKAIADFTAKHPELAGKPVGGSEFFDAMLDDVKASTTGQTTGVQYLLNKDEVKALQGKLGVDDDGLWGPKTQAAFEKYCRENNIDPANGLNDNLRQSILSGAAPAAPAPAAPAVAPDSSVTVTDGTTPPNPDSGITITAGGITPPNPDSGVTITAGTGITTAPDGTIALAPTSFGGPDAPSPANQPPAPSNAMTLALSEAAMAQISAIRTVMDQTGTSAGHEAEHAPTGNRVQDERKPQLGEGMQVA